VRLTENTRFFAIRPRWQVGLGLAAVAILLAAISLDSAASGWSSFKKPSKDFPEPIGRYANGCIKGSQPLADRGIGYQIIRLSRNRYYGHPDLINFLTLLGLRVDAEGLGTMLVGDMAMPRGGRFSSGHRSHQTGLDVDIWLRLDLPQIPAFAREKLESVSMVNFDEFRVAPDQWSDKQQKLIQLAADDERVSRIFVHPAIKLELCNKFSVNPENTKWLRKVRPWYGHNEHMHVRLKCPADAPLCVNQPPPPPGNGCGKELASWFPDPNRKPVKKVKKPRQHRIIVMPRECYAMLSEGKKMAQAEAEKKKAVK